MKDYLQYLSQGLISQKDSRHSLDSELNPYSPFLCSLSGGQDSTSLFFLLFHFFNTLQISSGRVAPLTVFYCHHFWQPKNVFLMRFLLQLTVLFHSQYFVTFSKKSVPNENRSRRLRKKSLSRIAILQNTNTLLTGHTETDRFETLFTNLVRGTTVKNFSPRTFFHSKKEETFLFSSFNNNSTNILYFETNLLSKMIFFDTQVRPKKLIRKIGKESEIEKTPKMIKFGKETKNRKNQFFYLQKTSQQVDFLKQRRGGFSFFQQKCSDSAVFPNLKIVEKRAGPKFARQIWKVKQVFRENDFRFDKEFSSSFSFYSFSSLEMFWWKPFTTTERFFVKNSLDFYEFPILTDLTNFSCQFSRNKIRHQFLPFFKFLFHEKVERLVLQCFQIHGEEHEIIENKVTELILISFLAESLLYSSPNFSSLGPKNFSKWFLANVSQSLQLAFLQKLMFKHKNREGAFFQFSAFQTQFFGRPKVIKNLKKSFVQNFETNSSSQRRER